MKRLLRHVAWVNAPKLELDEGHLGWEAGRRDLTARQRGDIAVSELLDLPGCNGEVRNWRQDGGFGNYSTSEWQEFLDDVAVNGIQDPLMIWVNADQSICLAEGNHRLQAALQLDLPSVPVDIRYFGNSQHTVSRFGLGEGNYPSRRKW